MVGDAPYTCVWGGGVGGGGGWQYMPEIKDTQSHPLRVPCSSRRCSS